MMLVLKNGCPVAVERVEGEGGCLYKEQMHVTTSSVGCSRSKG